MLGLDDRIAALSDGSSLWIVVVVAVLLGLRHASDPDHLAAVTTLLASGKERAARGAAELGLAWGLGHALTLIAFGLPVLLLNRYLPERVQQAAETAVALVIVYLAVRLLVRWRRGMFHVHPHEHGGRRHSHVHAHGEERGHAHRHRTRTPLGAFAIGLVHGMGGSAGVSVLLLACGRVDGARGHVARPARRLHSRVDVAPVDRLRAHTREPAASLVVQRGRASARRL